MLRAASVTALLGVAIVLGGAPASAAAQVGPSVTVLRLAHDPHGRIVAAVRTSDGALLAPASVTVLVDGVPRAARVTPALDTPGATAIEVGVPPLPIGSHTVVIRLAQGPLAVVIERAVDVDNAGLLRLTVTQPAEPRQPIEVRTETMLPTGALDLRYLLDGASMDAVGAGRVQIDPWRSAPGAKTVEVQAFADARLVASARVDVEVPALEPALAVEQAGVRGGTQLTVRANVQAATVPTVLVRDGPQVLLRTQETVARVMVPPGSRVSVEVVSGEAVVLAQGVTTASTASGGWGFGRTTLLVLTVGLAAGALVFARVSMRRNSAVLAALAPAPPPRRASSAPTQLWPVALGHLPRLIVRGPDGVVRRLPVPTDSAVTIGSGDGCDIRLDDASLRPIHGRLTPFADGHFVLQSMGLEGEGLDLEGEGGGDGGMVIVRPREEVHVGRYVLVIE